MEDEEVKTSLGVGTWEWWDGKPLPAFALPLPLAMPPLNDIVDDPLPPLKAGVEYNVLGAADVDVSSCFADVLSIVLPDTVAPR